MSCCIPIGIDMNPGGIYQQDCTNLHGSRWYNFYLLLYSTTSIFFGEIPQLTKVLRSNFV